MMGWGEDNLRCYPLGPLRVGEEHEMGRERQLRVCLVPTTAFDREGDPVRGGQGESRVGGNWIPADHPHPYTHSQMGSVSKQAHSAVVSDL